MAKSLPTRPERILILGGTREARELASRLAAEGYGVITSLAGVTETPALPEGRLRRGGFGGVTGLARYLGEEAIACLIDATHPFAAQMSQHAHDAATATGVPLLRLERPAWDPGAEDRWIGVGSVGAAVRALPPGANAFVTIGRKDIAAFFERGDVSGVARMIEAPEVSPPPNWTILLARPPFNREAEIELLAHHRITHVVAKNAGGEDTSAKIVAARRLRIPIVMIARPRKPDAPIFSTAKMLIPALRRVLLP